MSGDDKEINEAQELEQWRGEWKELGGEAGFTKELATRAVKDGRRIRRSIALEIVATIFSTSLCVWLLARSRGELVTVVVCAGILVFNGVWVTRLMTLKESAQQTKTTSAGLDAFIDLTRKRMDAELKWNTFARRSMNVLAIALVPWSVFALVARWPMYRAEPWRGVVGFGVAFGILVAVYLWQRHKRQKLVAERERFETLIAERTLA